MKFTIDDIIRMEFFLPPGLGSETNITAAYYQMHNTNLIILKSEREE